MEHEALLEQFISGTVKIKKLLTQFHCISREERIATFLQFRALSYLKTHPKASVGSLAEDLMMSSGSVAQLTDRLFNNGWIKREDDTNDKRIILLSLTDKGEDQFKEMKKKFSDEIGKHISSIFSERELRRIVKLEERILKRLEKREGKIERIKEKIRRRRELF